MTINSEVYQQEGERTHFFGRLLGRSGSYEGMKTINNGMQSVRRFFTVCIIWSVLGMSMREMAALGLVFFKEIQLNRRRK